MLVVSAMLHLLVSGSLTQYDGTAETDATGGWMFGSHKHLEKQLRARGRSAQATILDAKSGVSITSGDPALAGNTQVVWKLRLRITPDGEPPFEAETSARFGQLGGPQPGNTVFVLYDPDDHTKVVVDQSEAAMKR